MIKHTLALLALAASASAQKPLFKSAVITADTPGHAVDHHVDPVPARRT